jgi:hypothetical protein
MSKEITKDLQWSEYTLLNQIPITKSYAANDDGIFKVEFNPKTKTFEKDIICEAFHISTINKDRNTETEVTELQFMDYSSGKPKVQSLQIPTSILTKEAGMELLAEKGFNISNPMGFKKFMSSVKINLNSLVRKEIDNPYTKRYYGSRHYGFELIDGEYNFNNFIGIDSPIMPSESFAELDKVLFKPLGDLDKEKEFLDWISKGSKCELIYKQIVACALMGITKIYLGKTVDNPVVEVISPSSSGKGFLDHIVQKVWGKINDEKGLSVSSSSSAAGLAPFNDHIYVLPIIIADITDFIKKYGVEAAGSLIYEHTNSNNTIKAQSDRQISKYNYACKNVMLMMAEKDEIAQQKDGVISRVVRLNTNLKRGTASGSGEKVSERDFVEIDKRQHESYGIIGPEYVQKIREYHKDHYIRDEFGKVMAEYEKALKTTSKNAAIYALIEYTYNLAYDFGLLPERWGKMTVKENLANYEAAEAISSDEEIYNLMAARIESQTEEYPNVSVKLTQTNYEERRNNGKAVRGRIDVKEYEGKKYKVAIIPRDNFNANVADLIKRHALASMKVNPKNWIENGWFLPDNGGRADHDGTNITREYNRNDDMKCSKERCFWLVLEDLSTPERQAEKEEERLEKEAAEKEVNEQKMKALIKNAKYLQNDGLMEIPSGIDPDHLYDPEEIVSAS